MSRVVVVTGACGRVGRSLVAALTDEGFEVRGIDRSVPQGRAREAVELDLADTAGLTPLVRDADFVVHLAALMSWDDGDASALFRSNVAGTFGLLEAARCGRGPRVVVASSGEVYPEGSPEYLPIDEMHPTAPRSQYGMNKLLIEQMAWFYARRYELPMIVLRLEHTQDAAELLDPASVFSGPRFFLRAKLAQQRRLGNDRAVVALQAHDNGTERLLLSRGEDGRPYRMPICDTRDTVAGIIAALTSDRAVGEVIGLGPSETVAFDQIVPRMSALTGLDVADVCLPGAAVDYSIDISKAERLLGFVPAHRFDGMLVEAQTAYQQRASA